MSDELSSLEARIWGQQIRAGRLGLFLTQERFADAIVDAARNDGEQVMLDQSAVSQWERGVTKPALRYRRHIATVLGMEPTVLFRPIGAVA